MKQRLHAFLAVIMTLQLLLSGIVTVNAEDTSGIGEAYTAPDSPAVTYNMNLDWKFKETSNGTTASLEDAINSVDDEEGDHFYSIDYDDSEWETVSIPHGINGEDAFTSNTRDAGGGMGRIGVFLYRKTFTVPESAEGGKVFFELEGIRQAAYVWVNGKKVGYYEAGITAMGFDITNFVVPGETAVIAIANDATATSGNPNKTMYETVPGEEWGSSYTLNNGSSHVGDGVGYEWNVRSFNEVQAGLVYNAYLHVTGSVYQTFPLYNNLKTTGNYIYADNFDIRGGTATIHVDAEVRNESDSDGSYTLEVAVVDAEGNLAYQFESSETSVAKASDAGVVYETAVERDVYDAENIANPVGLTKVNTVEVTHITASCEASDVRFWSLDDPYLYTVYTILKDSDGNVVDVQDKETGFRKVEYDPNSGIMINDKAVWLKGYAQRSTNEWAVIGVATDWLTDYDMSLLKENNANFIRWMHVAPKPAAVRSSDKYGIAVVCPAGDKEAEADERQWSQRTEAMRDAMIYFRNSPSVIFWETGNNAISAEKAEEMNNLRLQIDPYGMRFIGARSTRNADQLNYEGNYAGTMYGNYADAAKAAMQSNGIMGPIMETEYAREESPRRVWDDYSPPDYDYVNKALWGDVSKLDGYDAHDLTQEEITVKNVKEYNNYYSNRVSVGSSLYSAEAMMVWSDSNMHGRNSASENCRTSGRVDAVRQTKEMFEGTKVMHSDESAVHIIGHWSYPEVSDDTYNYYETEQVTLAYNNDGTAKYGYDAYTSNVLKRDPTTKTVYAIGSADVSKIDLYRIDGDTETLIGSDDEADSNFVYQFDNIDVTKGDGVIAKAYNARGAEVATDEIARSYDAVTLRLTAHTAVTENEDGETVSNWKADGSDIAYIDVEVIDENGNVCVLNYDKINFTYSDEGVYLGGYNSGTGSNCFQNTTGSEGLSNYFGGAKNGESTIRKDYVYAENGTNRIFIKSTRNAGSFTLTASMDGMYPVQITLNSTAVDTAGGLTDEMQSTLDPGVSEAPVTTTVAAMKPLMQEKFAVDWGNVITVTESDDTVYYKTIVNGSELELEDGLRTRAGTPSGVFGAVEPILEKLNEGGAGIEYTIDGSPLTLTFKYGGHEYTVKANTNEILTDGKDATEIVQNAEEIDGELFVNLGAVLNYMGVGVMIDDTNKTVTIAK